MTAQPVQTTVDDGPTHGTLTCYQYGCRDECCKAARRARHRQDYGPVTLPTVHRRARTVWVLTEKAEALHEPDDDWYWLTLEGYAALNLAELARHTNGGGA